MDIQCVPPLNILIYSQTMNMEEHSTTKNKKKYSQKVTGVARKWDNFYLKTLETYVGCLYIEKKRWLRRHDLLSAGKTRI